MGGDQLGTVRPDRDPIQGGVERVERESRGLVLVEHRERGIEPRRERVCAQHARAEAVNRGDRRSLGRARRLVRAERPQARANPLTQLGGRLLGERDRQDRADVDAVVQDGADEPLDQHRRLTAAGARIKQQIAVTALDRRDLLWCEGDGHPAQQIPGDGIHPVSRSQDRESARRDASSTRS